MAAIHTPAHRASEEAFQSDLESASAALAIFNDEPAAIRVRLEAAVEAFGPLAVQGKQSLLNKIVEKILIYRSRESDWEQHLSPSPGERAKFLGDVSKAATRLLKVFGIADRNAITNVGAGMEKTAGIRSTGLRPEVTTDLLVGLQRVSEARRPVTAILGATERMDALLVLLSDLVEAADLAHGRVEIVPSKWGGSRREEEPIGALLQDFLQIYVDMRKFDSRSGPAIGFGGPLLRFVSMAVAVADPKLVVKDESVKKALRTYRGRSRRKDS